MITENRRHWLAMFFLAVLVSVSFQGTRGIYETSEGRYAECAREMLEFGNYMEPTLGYRPHWTKPPLTYWAIAGGIKLLGVNEWGVRLYNVVAFLVTVLAVAYLGRVLFDDTTGILAGLVYVSSPLPVFGAYAATTDTLLALWTILVILCYVKEWRAEGAGVKRRWLIGMWALFGLGFATKGPVALIPIVPILFWHHRYDRKTWLVPLLGLLLFAALGLSWYVVVGLRHDGLFAYFLKTEVLHRLASGHVHSHSWYKSLTIYLPTLLFGGAVWPFFAVITTWKKGLLRPTTLRSYFQTDPQFAFLLLWLMLPLGIFVIISSKLPLYVLPLYAPISLLFANTLRLAHTERQATSRVLQIAFLSAVCLVCVKGASAYLTPKRNMKTLYELCRTLDEGNTKFMLVSESKLYGLQYYLDGRLRRITTTGREPWADMRLRGAVAGFQAGRNTTSCVLIAENGYFADMDCALRRAGLHFRSVQNEFWTLYSILPAAVRPNHDEFGYRLLQYPVRNP